MKFTYKIYLKSNWDQEKDKKIAGVGNKKKMLAFLVLDFLCMVMGIILEWEGRMTRRRRRLKEGGKKRGREEEWKRGRKREMEKEMEREMVIYVPILWKGLNTEIMCNCSSWQPQLCFQLIDSISYQPCEWIILDIQPRSAFFVCLQPQSLFP